MLLPSAEPCFAVRDWPLPIHWQINPLEGMLPLEGSVRDILAWLGREEAVADGLDP